MLFLLQRLSSALKNCYILGNKIPKDSVLLHDSVCCTVLFLFSRFCYYSRDHCPPRFLWFSQLLHIQTPVLTPTILGILSMAIDSSAAGTLPSTDPTIASVPTPSPHNATLPPLFAIPAMHCYYLNTINS